VNIPELLASARSGDRVALSRLLGAHLRVAHAVALGVVPVWDEAADVVQAAFLAAVEHLDQCREPERFSAWLLRIVRNTALDLRRASGRARAYGQAWGTEQALAAAARADRVLSGEARRPLLAALAGLTERRRQVLLLHDLEGWKHAEIAELLNVSEVLSRQELFVARREVRAALADADMLKGVRS
jgi:RNA polymerase sigma-70 factor, ECF subfamily